MVWWILYFSSESQEEKEEYFSTMIEDQVWVDTWCEDWEYSDEIIRDCVRAEQKGQKKES